MRAMRCAAAFVVAIVLLLAPAGAASAASSSLSLPPSARKDLVAIFGKKVAPFGLRVTRAALVNPKEKRDPKGTHLAIYVEPTGRYTPDDYLTGTITVTRVFLPYVFHRWNDLKSFDVCQEPRPAVDDSPVPVPETQVYATRAGAKLVDWPTATLATMIETSQTEATAAGTQRPVRFSLFVTKHLQNIPTYQAAAATSATTTTPAAPTVRDYG
jgi:hypothetical protein